jgi:hypothetical protein
MFNIYTSVRSYARLNKVTQASVKREIAAGRLKTRIDDDPDDGETLWVFTGVSAPSFHEAHARMNALHEAGCGSFWIVDEPLMEGARA